MIPGNKVCIFLALVTLFSCTTPAPKISKIPKPESPETIPLYKSEESYLTLVAVGDNLFQEPILREFRTGTKYDFSPLYQYIQAWIEPADIAFVNQETVLGRPETGYTGYPLFNTPQEAGLALAAAGFNVINHATNHALDMGEDGIIASIDFWENLAEGSDSELQYLGIFRSITERKKRLTVIEKNNIKVGFLAYTCDTNAIPLPPGKPYLLGLADMEQMEMDIAALRPRCDFLVVSMHWGNEYEEQPSAKQKQWAAFLAEQQVDLIIGHHPHVLQAPAWLPRAGGTPVLCCYSLGNFIAAHARPTTASLLGGLLFLRLKKIDDTVSIDEAGFVPLITHYEKGQTGYRVYPLGEYTEDLMGRHEKKSELPYITIDYFIRMARNIFGPLVMLSKP